MKKIFWVLALVMVFASGPVYAGKAMQMWNCGMEGDATEETILAAAGKWLAAAKKVDGGADLSATVLFPVAVNASGETDFVFVVTAPSFSDWGKFWDAYPDSEAAQTEDTGTFCPDSVIWDAVKVK